MLVEDTFLTGVRVVLVDDHTLFRRGLKELLEDHGAEVIGEASNGRMAAQLVSEIKPDVVVMDLNMPVMDGVEATRLIAASTPKARVVMHTVSVDDDDVIEALIAGASGYLLKDAPPEEVVHAVRAAADGESTLASAVTARVVERVRRTDAQALPAEPPKHQLSERELEILRCLAKGLDNPQIAERLYISPKTVKNHVANILEKLGVENRTQAAVYAVRAGIS